jgi:ficolin
MARLQTRFFNLKGEFWLGLDKIHRLTTSVPLTALRFDMEDTSGNKRYAWYDSFAIADEQHKYELSVGAYVGNLLGNVAKCVQLVIVGIAL